MIVEMPLDDEFQEVCQVSAPQQMKQLQKVVIQGKYTELTANAYGKLIVAPNKTIPICNGIVPTRRVINVVGALKNMQKESQQILIRLRYQ